MCGGGLGRVLPILADVAAVATGNPELIPVIQGGSTLLQGGSIGDAAKNAGLAFAGQEILPVVGNAFASAFPETAGNLGITGGANSLTDLFGQTTGGGSFAGPGTIGGDFLGNFSPGSGLSQLFGGTAAPSGDLTNAYNAVNTAAPNATATAGATNPVDFASGGPSSSYAAGAAAPGSAGVGGGSLPGGIGEDLTVGSAQGGAPITSGTQDLVNSFAADQGAALPTDALPPSVIAASNAATPGGLDISLNQPGMLAKMFGSTTPIPQSGGSTVSGLSSLFGGQGGGNNMLNGLLRAGAGYALNNNNSSGLNAITNAANQAQQNYQPYYAAGTQAENTLANLYGNNGTSAQTAAMQNFQNTPGYQFALNQGLNALNANNAAMGQTLSGNAQEGINNYAQGVASQQYNNYINQLQNLASGGMSAVGGMGTAGLTGAGARAQLGQNNANNMNTALGTGLSALFPTQLDLQKLLGNGGAGGSGGLLSLFQ